MSNKFQLFKVVVRDSHGKILMVLDETQPFIDSIEANNSPILN